MKKRELVAIEFEYNQVSYTAVVQKYAPTAIILPNHTILKTNCVVLTSTTRRRSLDQPKHTRQIFNGLGELVALSLLRRAEDWAKPFESRFPIIFAQKV